MTDERNQPVPAAIGSPTMCKCKECSQIAVIFPHSNGFQVSDREFVAAWKVWFSRCGPNGSNARADPMPILADQMAYLLKQLNMGREFSVDVLCRLLSPHPNTMQASRPFRIANAHLLVQVPATNPMTGRRVNGLCLSPHGQQLLNSLRPADEAPFQKHFNVILPAFGRIGQLLKNGYKRSASHHRLLGASVFERNGECVVVVTSITLGGSKHNQRQQEVDDYFRSLQRMLINLKKRFPKAALILPGGGNIHVPGWFLDWCKQQGISVAIEALFETDLEDAPSVGREQSVVRRSSANFSSM